MADVVCPATNSLGRATAALGGASWVLFVVHGFRANNYVGYVVENVVWGFDRFFFLNNGYLLNAISRSLSNYRLAVYVPLRRRAFGRWPSVWFWLVFMTCTCVRREKLAGYLCWGASATYVRLLSRAVVRQVYMS